MSLDSFQVDQIGGLFLFLSTCEATTNQPRAMSQFWITELQLLNNFNRKRIYFCFFLLRQTKLKKWENVDLEKYDNFENLELVGLKERKLKIWKLCYSHEGNWCVML